MVRQALLNDVLALPVDERIEMFERLRDSLRVEPSASQLSTDLRELLNQRIDDYEQDPSAGSSWDEVKARLRSNLSKP